MILNLSFCLMILFMYFDVMLYCIVIKQFFNCTSMVYFWSAFLENFPHYIDLLNLIWSDIFFCLFQLFHNLLDSIYNLLLLEMMSHNSAECRERQREREEIPKETNREYKGTEPKKVQNPVEQTSSPIVPCPSSETICVELWMPKDFDGSTPPTLKMIVAPMLSLLH